MKQLHGLTRCARGRLAVGSWHFHLAPLLATFEGALPDLASHVRQEDR